MVLVVARETALECCSSAAFADRLAARGSYADIEEIVAAAREIWWNQVGTVARHGMSGMWQHLCLCRGLPDTAGRKAQHRYSAPQGIACSPRPRRRRQWRAGWRHLRRTP